ncbi:HlyD family efflux transporter periplasmic adaptor subunit [Neolewinella lacunae]|uniref:HlyD family efflux transporter periplasmic adaptor subunit n=1 Tax=Neolewinella lacunae TaxID=1517758 RepID=A0A923PGM9_9BACT|nr:HlyD family efflux transporter periplasmic adaptor subunit [Neolewinella lacunae]MBC6993758.1 HlyD family efflux transporter periplasmic adaptor subunit [Neolewinella lacunae]MDN3635241.1 HlyD family efflux transporter periplasmic adaptor subunit [Neolewinella lacunae]
MAQVLNSSRHDPAYTVEGLYARHHQRTYPVYLAVVFSVVLIALALPFITVAVGSEGRAILQTTERPTSLLAPTAGRVLFARLRDNLSVAAGDTVLILDPSELHAESSHHHTQAEERRAAIKDLQELIRVLPADGFPQLSTALYQRDYQDFRHQWDEASLKAAHTARQLERQEKLFASGTIAPMEIERFRFEHELASNEQTQLKERRRHLWAQELVRNEQEHAELQQSITKLQQQSRHLVITAPVGGHLVQTTALPPGSFVGPAQEIAVISPAGELEVAIQVAPQDIGLLRTGTPVSLQMDAFTHTRWGLARATVREIDNDVSTDQFGHPHFVVRCTLADAELRLASGHRGQLAKGMTATAHFTLARRTLAQLLRDRLEDWLPTPQIVE